MTIGTTYAQPVAKTPSRSKQKLAVAGGILAALMFAGGFAVGHATGGSAGTSGGPGGAGFPGGRGGPGGQGGQGGMPGMQNGQGQHGQQGQRAPGTP